MSIIQRILDKIRKGYTTIEFLMAICVCVALAGLYQAFDESGMRVVCQYEAVPTEQKGE